MSTANLDHLLGQTIEILISCTGLADLDEFSKSDPMCVMFCKQYGQWKEYGRTEAIVNSLNPETSLSKMLPADLDEISKSDPMCVMFCKQYGQWKEYGRTEAIVNSLNPKTSLSKILLADLDEFSKSDPMCVMFCKQYGQWKEYGRTEAIVNSLNPKFTESFMIDYDQDTPNNLMFSVYDVDNRSHCLKHHDLVGSVEVTFSELIDPMESRYTICKTLRVSCDSRARGIISITTEVVRPSRDKLSVHVGGHKLIKTGKIIQSKPDVYLEISRAIDNVSYHPVYRSETMTKTQNPRWRPFEISLQRLCNGDWDRPLEFTCWHHSGTGDYKMIGRKISTLRDMNMIKREGQYKEVSLCPKKNKPSKNSIKITSCGHLRFYQFRVDCQYSLLEYIRGGLNLKPIIGIDFTSSNGKVDEPLSLHNKENGRCNQYVDVLESFGALVSQYNIDNDVAMFGFGAKWKTSDKTSHCFPITGDWENVQIKGIKRAITEYKSASERLIFSGPTRLKPVVAMAESMSVRPTTQESQHYNVLIVITDGVINDIDEVTERIISISHLPLSIIFVGVGPADFSLMEVFNHHNTNMLSIKMNDNSNKKMTSLRRNTHFVSYRKDSPDISRESLAKDAFAVLSTQVVDYMKSREILPNKPKMSMSNASSDTLLDIDMSSSVQFSKRSLRSRNSTLSERSLDATGPTCPTCGSNIDTIRPIRVVQSATSPIVIN